MKFDICVVTGYEGENYGTKLQSTALCKYFEQMGYSTMILNKFRVMPWFLLHPNLLINRLINYMHIKRNRAFFEPSPYTISKNRNYRLHQYEKENYNILTINKYSIWKEILKSKCHFIVGSDIIWQPSFGIPGKWFLDFTYHTKLRKFSYATSIGANELPKKYFPYYRKYLSEFSAIGVREKKAVILLKSIIDQEVVNVIDPTLLHDVTFWDQYAVKAKIPKGIKEGAFIFCYFVMDDFRYWEYMKLVAKKSKLQIVVLPMHVRDEQTPYTIITDGTPYEFVWLIKNAAFICTDSFHACAFSLNYKKEFYLLRRARKDEDAKYDDFFERYGLKERNIKDETVFIRNKNIDYVTAHKQLKVDRQFAYEFISRALDD